MYVFGIYLRVRQADMGMGVKQAAVMAMVSNEFSIADPEDDRMLDVVGFDPAPQPFIADYAAALL